MRRAYDKIPPIAAISLATHLCVLALVKLLVPMPYYASANAGPDALPAPLIVPEPREQPPPIERNESNPFGEKTGDGDSVASIDLPARMQEENPHDFEQAWMTQKASLPTPAQEPLQARKSSALVPSGIDVTLPTMAPREIGQGDSPTPAPPDERPKEETASEADGTDGADDQTRQEAQAANADPAPQGQTDLDPFADAEGISLLGGVKARKGREIRFTRPRVDLAFRAEFTRLADRRMDVVFRITTDSGGRPRNVALLRSSGSDDIDESLRLALYDSWFGGKMPDDFVFAIRFYGD